MVSKRTKGSLPAPSNQTGGAGLLAPAPAASRQRQPTTALGSNAQLADAAQEQAPQQSDTPLLDAFSFGLDLGEAHLSRGYSGFEVRSLQQALNNTGASLVVDGIFGRATERAVRSFQSSRGLMVDGIVGPQTRGALEAEGALSGGFDGGGAQLEQSAPEQSAPEQAAPEQSAPAAGGSQAQQQPAAPQAAPLGSKLLRVGERGPDVARLQQALNEHGANLPVNGIFDDATRLAVVEFQLANGLRTDGVVGPQTGGALQSGTAQSIDWAADAIQAVDEAMQQAVEQSEDQGGGQAPPQQGPAPQQAGEGLAGERGALAAKSARLEYLEGVARYGGGTWETNGSNRGALVDEYAQANHASPSQRYAWCGMFVGYQFEKAGIRSDILRGLVFWSGYRLHKFLTQGEYLGSRQPGDWWQPHHTVDLRNSSGERRRAAIDAFGPQPGDIVLFRSDFSHVAIVSSYDSASGEFELVEGNRGDRVQATSYTSGDRQITFLGRFNDSDYEPNGTPDASLASAQDRQLNHRSASGGVR